MKKLIIAVLITTLANLPGCYHQRDNDKESLVNVQGVSEVNMRMSNGQSIPVTTDDYVRLVDG